MTGRPARGARTGLALLLALTIGILLIAPYLGGEPVDPLQGLRALISGDDTQAGRILGLRLPRIALGLFAGGSLALAGACMQTLLRNALATPYTLGVSFAGAFGAFLALSFDTLVFSLGPLSSTALFAFVFACADVLALYLLVRRPNRIDTNELLLAGVTLNFFFGAAILLVRFLTDPLRLRAMDQWMMGGLQVAGWSELSATPVLLFPALVLLFGQSRGLDQLAFGEELAAARGVNVLASQRIILLAASLATAAVVAVTGPIGFVGLIAPHAVRALLGPHHRILLPGSFLLGGSFLVLADGLVRSLTWAGRGSELPVGVLTAMVGAPLFLVLLLRQRGAA